MSFFRIVLILFIQLSFINNAFGSKSRDSIVSQLQDLLVSNPDSVLTKINAYKADSVLYGNNDIRITFLHYESDAYKAKNNFREAYQASRKAAKLAETVQDSLLQIKAFNHYGNICFVVFQEEESTYYQDRALKLTQELYDKGILSEQDLYQAYLYQIHRCIRFQRFYEASQFLEVCYKLHHENNFGELSLAYLNSNKAFLLFKMNELDQALILEKEVESYFESIDDSSEYAIHKSVLPTVYSLLGQIYRLKEDYALSKEYLEKAMDKLETYPWNKNHLPVILENYAWLLYQTGDYDHATEFLNESKKLSEEYFYAKSLNNEEFKIVQARYQGELNQRMQELISKSLEIAEKDELLFKFKVAAVVIFLLLIIGGLVYRIKIVRAKHKSERLRVKEKARRTKELIKLKNKELTESTLKQIEKDKIIDQLKQELEQHPTRNTSSLLKTIDLSSKKMWEDFNTRFVSVNQDFYKKLNENYPNLTPNDQKLCALIKLNFSTKEMARLLGVSSEAIQKARYRLRKKMNLEREVNLTQYISSL